MNITEIRLHKIDREGQVRAIASITLENAIVIHGVKLIEGERGLFMSMPARRGNDGTYRDIVHPINHEVRTQIEEALIKEYESESTQATESDI